MEWEFTAEQVVRAEVAYGLADFRRDLAQELRANLAPPSEHEFRASFELLYDFCYWRATDRPVDDFVAALPDDPAAIRLVKAVGPHMGANIEMLGAILQRLIMDHIEAGMALEDAVRQAAAKHRALVRELPAAAPAAATAG